jgi:hypothetical protein
MMAAVAERGDRRRRWGRCLITASQGGELIRVTTVRLRLEF